MRPLRVAPPGMLARGLLLVLLLLPLGGVVSTAGAAEPTAAATRQYNAAVGLQNSEEFALAADMWQGFLRDYAADPRAARAAHYLGICYFKQNKLAEAAEAFGKVIAGYPQFEMLAETYLNLGLTQYNLAQSGKAEMYDAAAQTFDGLVTRFPKDQHVAEALYYEGECLFNRDKKQQAAEKYALLIHDHPQHAMVSQALFALGATQADLGQHKAALATFDDFLRKYPTSDLATETTLWRGESLYALGEYADAARAYATAAADAKFAMADYATLRQADALAAAQQLTQAAAVYASVPEKFKDSKYAALGRLEAGKKYHAAGDYAAAQPFLEKAVAAGGDLAAEAAHWSARNLLKQGKPAEALAAVDGILPSAGKGPQAAALLTVRADALYAMADRRGESVAAYAAVAAEHPKDPAAPQAMYLAAFAAMELGDYPAALRHADAFLAAYGQHDLRIGAMHVKAESSLLSGRYAEAEKLFGELLAKAPGDRDAEIWKVHRGTALYLQEKYRETIAALEPVAAQLQTPDLAAEAWYRIGRSQSALGDYATAVKSLEAALAAAPQWKLADDTQLVLAYACQQTGDLPKARQLAEKLIADFPQSKSLDMAHYRLGECARLGGDLKTAAAEYRRILDGWPESALVQHALFGLGWAQLGQEDYAGAEGTFGTLIERFPKESMVPRARYGRAVARRQLKQIGPAIEDLDAVLAGSPSAEDKSQARHVLGLCQKDAGKLEEAAASFQKLMADDPTYAQGDAVTFELGWALKSLGREDAAAETFARLVEKYPQSTLAADSSYLVGDFYYDKKDYKEAAKRYFAASQAAGNTKLGEEAAYKLGLTYYLQDDFKNARQSFGYQRGTWPEGRLVGDAVFMEAECLFKEEQFEEALALYELVKTTSNKDADALALLHAGTSAAQLKQWQKSLELLQRCVREFPDSPYFAQALYEQGWAQQNLDRPDDALATYAQVVAKSNLEPAARAQFMIGEIQFQRKQHEEAIKSFFKVSYGYGYPQWQADATYEAARCFEVLGRTAQALAQYEKLVDEFPKSEKVGASRQRIEQLKQLP